MTKRNLDEWESWLRLLCTEDYPAELACLPQGLISMRAVEIDLAGLTL